MTEYAFMNRIRPWLAMTNKEPPARLVAHEVFTVDNDEEVLFPFPFSLSGPLQFTHHHLDQRPLHSEIAPHKSHRD